ncbi:MAG: hypothetical protein OWU84_10340 [Firmicutes bacterium]|nr:hypothetical protein [Bacillota bacterium]
MGLRRVATTIGFLCAAVAALGAMAGLLTLLAVMPIIVFVGTLLVYAVLSSGTGSRPEPRARVVRWPMERQTAPSQHEEEESPYV